MLDLDDNHFIIVLKNNKLTLYTSARSDTFLQTWPEYRRIIAVSMAGGYIIKSSGQKSATENIILFEASGSNFIPPGPVS